MTTEKRNQPDSVDHYLARVPDEHRDVLIRLRKLIKSVAPEAVESVSYGVPTYKLGGKPLVYFGIAKAHYSIYALSGAVREKYADDVAGYSMSKGTIRFPFDKPFPSALLKKLVKAQVEENRTGRKKKI